MEPMLPTSRQEELLELASKVISESAALGGSLPAPTRAELAAFLRNVNSYYSNLIEGHGTHPRDIERALRSDFSTSPEKRALQIESAAHVATQAAVEQRLSAEPGLDVCSADFLRWIHAEFYRRMPAEFRLLDGAAVEPGALRTKDVTIGLHEPPRHEAVPAFLRRFQEAYRFEGMTPLVRIVAAGAAHHRLAWIHPFLDGNGRVMRLFTHAWFTRCNVDGHGIWVVSRGLARRRQRYRELLQAADRPRRGDYDGRGALTDEGLAAFCAFFLETALDQIRFSARLLDLPSLRKRVEGYARVRAAAGELPDVAGHLLVQALLEGEVARGDAARIVGLRERAARKVVSRLVAEGLLQSKSHRAPLRLAFPAKAAQYYFPDLYPPLDFAEE